MTRRAFDDFPPLCTPAFVRAVEIYIIERLNASGFGTQKPSKYGWNLTVQRCLLPWYRFIMRA
jgi:hypothetical protein